MASRAEKLIRLIAKVIQKQDGKISELQLKWALISMGSRSTYYIDKKLLLDAMLKKVGGEEGREKYAIRGFKEKVCGTSWF